MYMHMHPIQGILHCLIWCSATLEVLTRREQLHLNAKMKEEKQNGGGTTRGGGRGRGRGGRGRGKKIQPSTEPSGPAPEKVPEPHGVESDMDLDKQVSSSKRATMCTPERRKLFHDTGDEISPSKDKDDKDSPPIKPKKSKRPKRAQKTPKSKSNAAGSKDKPSEEPSITPPETEPSRNVEPAEEKETKVKPPTDRQKTWAEGALMDAKNDSPSWDHVTKLFEATKKDEREPYPKMHYWGLSMYSHTRRVGLLQQQKGKGKKVHVMSFSGGAVCTHIGIPLAATCLVVRFLFDSKSKV